MKSLYGLKISPRKWYDTYSKYLKSDGWVCDEKEPGLFRKVIDGDEYILTIYVDDTLVCGFLEKTCKLILDIILDVFTGKHEPPK